jgi:hypothetical protein
MKKIHTPISSSIGNQDEDVHEERRLLLGLRLDLDVVLEQVRHQPDVAGRVAGHALALDGRRLELAPFDGDLGDAARLHLVEELRVLQRRLRRLAGVELVEHGHQDQADYQPDDQVFKHVVQGLAPVLGGAAKKPVYAVLGRLRRRARVQCCFRPRASK